MEDRKVVISVGKEGVVLMEKLLRGELSQEEEKDFSRKLLHGTYNISSEKGSYQFAGVEDVGQDGVYIVKQEEEYFLILRRNDWIVSYEWVNDNQKEAAVSGVKEVDGAFLDRNTTRHDNYEHALMSNMFFILKNNNNGKKTNE